MLTVVHGVQAMEPVEALNQHLRQVITGQQDRQERFFQVAQDSAMEVFLLALISVVLVFRYRHILMNRSHHEAMDQSELASQL